MVIKFDEKEALAQLNCLKIEMNAKPDLMSKVLNNESTLVLVVDLINGFCKKGALYSQRAGAAALAAKEFLDALPLAHKAFLRDCHSPSAIEFKWFPPHCDNEEECARVTELRGIEGIDLPKNSTNGFFALQKKIPDFEKYSNFAVIGVCTDICVMQLCLSLRAYLNEINSPSNVLVFTDLVDTYSTNLHDADLMNMFALKIMEQAGIQIFKNIK